MIIAVLQEIDTTSKVTILGSIIGILILFIGAMYLYFKGEVKIPRDELSKEREYIRLQGEKNITAVLENNMVLKRLTSSLENTNEKVADIKQINETTKPIIEKNAERILDLRSHLKLNNGD